MNLNRIKKNGFFLCVLGAVSILFLTQTAWGKGVSKTEVFTITLTIPSIVGVNTPRSREGYDQSETQEWQTEFTDQVVWRENKKILLRTALMK